MSRYLESLALGVLLPGFDGTEAPSWVLDRLERGLGGVVLFGRNVAGRSAAEVRSLTEGIHTAGPGAVVSIDEESGDVTRLEAAAGSSYPAGLALGYVDDDELTYRVAERLGRDLVAAGIDLDLAPSVDVNSNPDNPVIGTRSFGADPGVVSRHTAAWIRGLQSTGVAACAKHFPGHGDTAVDSHLGLPVVDLPDAVVRDVHLAPFRAAVAAGTRSVMTAHISVPAVDLLPATISRRWLRDVLREELGFTGCVVTDALEMRGIAGSVGVLEGAVRALDAGADALIVGGELRDEAVVDALVGAVSRAVTDGRLAEGTLAAAGERLAALRSNAAQPALDGDRTVGLEAARRAVHVTGDVRLAAAAHVVRVVAPANIAVGASVPWGVASALDRLLPGTREVVVDAAESAHSAVAAAPADRPLVVVVRDAGRHAHMASAVAAALEARPDTVVVEMGVPVGRALAGAGRVVRTHGASRASGTAGAEVLAGVLAVTGAS